MSEEHAAPRQDAALDPGPSNGAAGKMAEQSEQMQLEALEDMQRQQQSFLEAQKQSMLAAGGEQAAAVDAGMWPGFDKFSRVQDILDHNRLLINEIKHNHDTRDPEGLVRNVSLIRELNDNVAKVVDLYGEISQCFLRAFSNTRKP